MRFLDLIIKKRDGFELNEDEIKYFVSSILKKEVPDYQVSSFLMAVFFKGMSFKETSILTREMAFSGEVCDLSFLNYPTVDKHSTGGVGDKISIILAPLIASCDVSVPMMSGRGLGHTGGTLDKLESIPGFNVFADKETYYRLLKENLVAMIGQTENIAPADKYLYALRDATATVESIPLITSSIMSKKIAEGTKNLVIDLKVGKGAFMKNKEDAINLGRSLIETGKLNGVNTMCVLTNMDEPLGYAIGNSLEVIECIEVMKGNFEAKDIVDLTITLGSYMLNISKNIDIDEAKNLCIKNLRNGKALDKFKSLISSQNGDIKIIDDYKKFKQPKYSVDLYFEDLIFEEEKNKFEKEESFYIKSIDAYIVGISATILGAGRTKKEDIVDHSAGILFYKKKGDRISRKEIILTLFSDEKEKINIVKNYIKKAFTFSLEKPKDFDLIIDILK